MAAYNGAKSFQKMPLNFSRIFPLLILGNAGRQAEMIQRKQEEYQRYVDQYFATKDQDVHQDTYR